VPQFCSIVFVVTVSVDDFVVVAVKKSFRNYNAMLHLSEITPTFMSLSLQLSPYKLHFQYDLYEFDVILTVHRR